MHRGVLPLAAHHAHIVHVVADRPHARFGVEHVPAREHADVIGGRGVVLVEAVEVVARKLDARGVGEALLRDVGGVVIDDRHLEADMGCKRGKLARGVGGAQKPHMDLVEQRDGAPGQALELLIVHRGAARDVLHLEHVARARRTRGHDFLRVVAEEDKRLAVGGTLVAVLLGDLVVGVLLRLGGVVDHLEAEPRQIALVDGADGALERGDVGLGQALRDDVEIIGGNVVVPRKRLSGKAGEILRRELRGLARLQVVDDGLQHGLVHGAVLSSNRFPTPPLRDISVAPSTPVLGQASRSRRRRGAAPHLTTPAQRAGVAVAIS